MSTDKDNRGRTDRGKINMGEQDQVKFWARQLGISRADLEKAVGKVGNSASAVRKHLGLM